MGGSNCSHEMRDEQVRKVLDKVRQPKNQGVSQAWHNEAFEAFTNVSHSFMILAFDVQHDILSYIHLGGVLSVAESNRKVTWATQCRKEGKRIDHRAIDESGVERSGIQHALDSGDVCAALNGDDGWKYHEIPQSSRCMRVCTALEWCLVQCR
jgi:hypothetical protein